MELQLRNGNVLKYDGAQVMGIINVTPDSFFSGSRCSGEANIRARVSEIIEEGGTMVDVGACSARPDADDVSAEEELSRLSAALPVVIGQLEALGCRDVTSGRYVAVSVDTFRACFNIGLMNLVYNFCRYEFLKRPKACNGITAPI